MQLGHHIPASVFRLRSGRMDPLLFIHLVLSCVLAAIALVLFLPLDTFDTGENWRQISHLFTEEQFGGFCAVIAVIGFLGASSRRNVLQAVSATCVCLMHLLLALSFLVSNNAGVGGWLCLAFAAEAIYVARRRIGGE